MRQQTLAGNGFERFCWRWINHSVAGSVQSHQAVLSKRKGAGRPTAGLERMLRIHFLQHWFNLSDPAVEEAMYDSRAKDFNKVRYRGLDKNANRLFVACGLVNVYMARKQLLRPT